MRILVTGGAGFIGSHYVRTLVAGRYTGFDDTQVTGLDKLTYAGNLAKLQPIKDSSRFHFVHRDICDPTASGQSYLEARGPRWDSDDAIEASPVPKLVHRPILGRGCRSARYQEDKQ